MRFDRAESLDSGDLTALGLVALQGIAAPDMAAQTRHVLRWYSKTFSTPLHVVQNLIPLEDVWMAYFEEKYEAMEPEELELAVQNALKPPEAVAQEIDQAQADKVADDAFAKMTEQAAATNPAPPLIPEPPPTTPPPVLQPDILFEFVDDKEMERLLSE